MPLGLSNYARRFITDLEGAKRALVMPVLVWEQPVAAKADLLLGTSTGAPMNRPRAGEPVVFEVKKTQSKQNAFGMGITVGRTENNDIVIEDNSVSRFHAYFQEAAKGGWKLVDAESKNGTWVGPLKLQPTKPLVLADQSRVRFGDIELVFMLPESFFGYIQKLIGD